MRRRRSRYTGGPGLVGMRHHELACVALGLSDVSGRVRLPEWLA